MQDTGPVSELKGLLRQWAAGAGGTGRARREALAVQTFELALGHYNTTQQERQLLMNVGLGGGVRLAFGAGAPGGSDVMVM